MLVNLWKLPWRQVRRSLTPSRPSKWWQLDPCQHFLCRTPQGVWTCVHMFIIHSQPSESVLWHPQQRFKVKWALCQVAHVYCVTGEECLNAFKSSCGKFLLPLPQFQPNLILSSERLYRKHPPSSNSSPFSHPRRLDACARGGRLFLCAFPPYTVHLCASVCGYCLPVLQQGLQSELFMRDLNTCKWFTPLPWHRSRLPMATAPSRSILPPLLLLFFLRPLLSGTRPPTMLSSQSHCFDYCSTWVGGCTL